MLKKIVVSVFFGFMIYFLAFNFNDSTDSASYLHANKISPSMEAQLSKEAAIEIAQKEVEYRTSFSRNSRWTVESKVVDAYPIFMDGIEGISYYECKVMTNVRDAGYILVNINNTDLLISESTTEGITLTECYREKINRDDFIILRYDWFNSLAVKKQPDILKFPIEIIASIGFVETDTLKNVIDSFRTTVLVKGCFPIYSKEELEGYYYEDLQSNECSIGWVNNAWAASYRDITAELKHTFPRCGIHYPQCFWHTPYWREAWSSDGHSISVGSGPAAWAIVYGYWAAFKGKNRLFNGHNVRANYHTNDADDDEIKRCMEEVAGYCKTDVANLGLYDTKPQNMPDGIRYAKNNGYKRSTCTRDRGSEFNKFDKVKSNLDADKPAILLIKYQVGGFYNRYVVIEAAKKRQKKVMGKWRDRDVSYTVNFGQGCGKLGRKEIYVREAGRNTHNHYSAFSVYLIDVK